MTLKAFSIRDTKSDSFGVPFFMPTSGAALRAFGDLVSDSQSNISRHPKDYILFEIGTFDDQTALFTSFPTPHNLGLASDFVPVTSSRSNPDSVSVTPEVL